jgi:flagellar biosynthetic protein FliR
VEALSLPEIAGTQVVGFLLTIARVGGIFMFAPAFSSPLIPGKVRIVAAGAFAVALTPIATSGHALPKDPIGIAGSLVTEMVIGLAFALSIGILAAGVQAAASLIDTVVGFSFASIVDPMSNMQSSVLGQLYGMVAALVFMLTGGDALMLQGLARSYRLLPIGAVPDPQAMAQVAVSGLAEIFVIGFQIAAPVVLTVLVIDAGLALVSRAVPQMNVFFVGMPLKILVGIAVVMVSLPLASTHIQGQLESVVADGLSAMKGK